MNQYSLCVSEIDTVQRSGYEPDNEAAKKPRIEVVDWEHSADSQPNEGSSGTVSLEQLMKEQITTTHSGEKLMIDNLWKILASEKVPGSAAPAEAAASHGARSSYGNDLNRQRSRSGLRNDSANRQKMAYGAAQYDQGHFQGMPQHMHDSARRPRPSDIFNTPYRKAVDHGMDLPRMPSSENKAYATAGGMGYRSAVRDMYGSGAKEDYMFRTPAKDSESGARGSTKTATPSAFSLAGRPDCWDPRESGADNMQNFAHNKASE